MYGPPASNNGPDSLAAKLGRIASPFAKVVAGWLPASRELFTPSASATLPESGLPSDQIGPTAATRRTIRV
jgi:hypothetical protein